MPDRLGQWGREAGWAALALVLVLGALEGILRAGDDFGRNGPPQIRAAPVDGVPVYRGRPWYAREFANPIHLNAEGYHAFPFDPDPARPRRVVVLGDSYVKGLHVPRDAHLTAVAQAQLPGVQVLSLGEAARFVPRQVDWFRDRFPALFGPQAPYGPVDAVVFCLRSHSLRHVAEGSTAYAGIPQVGQPWQYRLKARGQTARIAPTRRALRSPSHALSLLGHRAGEFLAADLRQAALVPDEADLDRAQVLMRERVLQPAVALARERGLRIGFLYLPSVSEALGAGHPVERGAHRRWREELQRLGVPWVDASQDLTRPDALFFPSDRHPNAAGHRAFGLRLAALLREMGLAGS